MSIGYDGHLFLLAFDHRSSFQKQLFGIKTDPTAAEAARISDAKALVFEGFVAADHERRLPEGAGILVDEQYGAAVARRAREVGRVLAMPVEASGREEFDFEYGDEFGRHIEAFDPTFAKVLVRYNPDGDAASNARQAERLRRLADWLHQRDRHFLFELLVPATKPQLASVGGDADRYDREVRPALVVRTIAAMQAAGVEADVWKIEGLDSTDDCRRVAEQARTGGRDRVICVVLGRGADESRVAGWLRAGARVPGYRGFAIGRTIWWNALAGWRDGRLDRQGAVAEIARRYREAIDIYEAAA